ncbi:MAG TPA: TipAS antibiotic-recognition domain-containing protein [Polyangiaceae bacterium]|nr:TipAS antibiotic-recognition domain-containing protein [Polyangiaceae bacterium]
MRIAPKLYSPRQMTMFARCSLAQLEYLSEIELVVPCTRTRDGQPRYDDEDLLRLQQVRIGRAHGLALEEIRRWLDACSHAFPEHQQPLNRKRRAQTRLYVETEVKVETDADRVAFQREARALYAALSARRCAGVAPADAELRAWTEWHCCHINRWFAACDPDEHIAFGRAIADNAYHSANIERHGKELTSFMLSVLEAHTPRAPNRGETCRPSNSRP